MFSSKRVWSFNQIQELIGAVKTHPCLYDRRNATYNQTKSKEDAWKSVSESISGKDKNADECKKKWKTLRIQQRRLLIKKIRKKGKFNGAQWNCYEPLKFLIPHMDWTQAEESSIKKEADGTATEDTDHDEDDENMVDGGDASTDDTLEGTQVAGVVSPVDLKVEQGAQGTSLDQLSITEQIVFRNQPYQPSPAAISSTKGGQTLSQFVLTYVPTSHRGNQDEALVETDATNSSTCRTSYAKAIDDSSQAHGLGATAQLVHQSPQIMHQGPPTSSTILSTSTIPSYQVVSSIDQMLPRSGGSVREGGGASGASLSSDLNYFLLDVAQAMNKMDDIAQMELKIEINKLLLSKLRDGKNAQSTT